MTQGVARPSSESRHHLRQGVEVALAGDQRVERRIGQHRERELHASAMIPSRTLGRRDVANLR